MESDIVHAFNRRIIQDFLDIIILKHMKNNSSMSGYDVIKYFHKHFHMLLSPGTTYSILYALERQTLIMGTTNNGKRVYKLTPQGEKFLTQICNTKDRIQTVISSIF